MLGFLRGDADCLVTTTIIESGLDIPTANTLIVERADQLGLSQAYQIRGRVGRSRERAFAYLLYPSAEALTEEAAARLSTLADHTELGSGFRIAMRDLDIRGAGNLLGDEQSGHVAAVGFELYCQMIDEAVGRGRARRRGASARRRRSRSASTSPSTPTCRPPSSPSRRRRSTSTAASSPPASRASCGRSATSSSDRFGPLPPQAENLLALQRARIELGLAGARSVEFRGGRLSVTGVELDSERRRRAGRAGRGRALRMARADRRGAGRRTSPRRAWPRCWRWPTGCARRGARRREPTAALTAGLVSLRSRHLTMLPGFVGAKSAAEAGESARAAAPCAARLRRALRRCSSSASRSPRASAIPSVPSGDVAVIEDAPDEPRHDQRRRDSSTRSLQQAAAGAGEKRPRSRATKNTKN